MAKKAQSTLPNMLVSLTVIALVAAAALATLNAITKAPIEKAQQDKVERAISAVLPKFDHLEETTIDGQLCRIGYDANNQIVGSAIESENDKGFGGHLKVMVGFSSDGAIYGYQILETHETPGLGAKASEWFQKGGKGDIIGNNPTENKLTVKKDGGQIDAISGSTITSRAFLDIINEASSIRTKINQ